MNKALIAGIDPGSTSAVAAFDLDRNLCLIKSRRDFPPRDIIKELMKTGKPIVVSCDTEKMPSTVSKVASSLGARKFTPEEDLEKSKKKQMGQKGSNSHEKDAIAAAYYAYNSMRKNIDKINRESQNSQEERYKIAKRRLTKEIRPREI